MGELTMDALRRQLKDGRLSRCYILYGEESYLREYYLRELRRQVLGTEDNPFNLRQLDGKNLRLEELRDAVDAYPTFGARAMVEVRDADLFPAGDAAAQALISVLQDIPEEICLCFIFDAVEYKPDRRRKSLMKAINAAADIVAFPIQGQSELTKWIRRHFRARERDISEDDAAYLLFLCGSRMDDLANEIAKIAVYARERQVSRSDIDAVAVPVVEAEAFKLADAMAAREYEKAAELMYQLLELSAEPIYLNALIGAQFRKLYAARLVKDAGGSIAALKDVLNTTGDYMAKQYLRICGGFSEARCRKLIRLSAETDYSMKSSGADAADLLRSLFVHLAAPEA